MVTCFSLLLPALPCFLRRRRLRSAHRPASHPTSTRRFRMPFSTRLKRHILVTLHALLSHAQKKGRHCLNVGSLSLRFAPFYADSHQFKRPGICCQGKSRCFLRFFRNTPFQRLNPSDSAKTGRPSDRRKHKPAKHLRSPAPQHPHLRPLIFLPAGPVEPVRPGQGARESPQAILVQIQSQLEDLLAEWEDLHKDE